MGMEGRPRSRSKIEQEEPTQQAHPAKSVSPISRRKMITTGTLAGATIGVPLLVGNEVKKDIEHERRMRGLTAEQKLLQKNKEELMELLVELEHAKPETFYTSDSEGLHISALEAEYLTGTSSTHKLTDRIAINGPRALFGLHERKLKRLKSHGKENPNIDSEAYGRSLNYVRRWNHPEKFASVLTSSENKRAEALGRASLEQTIESVEAKIKPIRFALTDPTYENADQMRGALENAYSLFNDNEVATARAMIRRVTTRMMLAYSMTELLSSVDGQRNITVYDFMLRTLGKEFIAGIPSEGDDVESIGQYQMTPYGFHDTSKDEDSFEDNSIVRNGASRANILLPDKLHLPKNLIDLHSYEDHAAAAYCYALNAIGDAVHSLSRPQQAVLKDRTIFTDEVLVAFIATSNNSPTKAKRALDAWLRAKAEGSSVEFSEVFHDPQLRIYAEKSIANYRAILDLKNNPISHDEIPESEEEIVEEKHAKKKKTVTLTHEELKDEMDRVAPKRKARKGE
jgi:uncharacterized protein YnzC (UPF0291/DUF896 family)